LAVDQTSTNCSTVCMRMQHVAQTTLNYLCPKLHIHYTAHLLTAGLASRTTRSLYHHFHTFALRVHLWAREGLRRVCTDRHNGTPGRMWLHPHCIGSPPTRSRADHVPPVAGTNNSAGHSMAGTVHTTENKPKTKDQLHDGKQHPQYTAAAPAEAVVVAMQ
jgi:hypothetical protein